MVEKNILIVDDDRGDRKLMRRYLAPLYPAATILEAENGDAAGTYTEEEVEVIFLDYLLPGESGLDLMSIFFDDGPIALSSS